MSDYTKRIEIKRFTMSKRKVEITCWRTGRVLFEYEAAYNTRRMTVEAAVRAGADLSGANLPGMNLSGMDLSHANLEGANLAWCDLSGTYLFGANLAGVNLAGANLSRVNLTWADMPGANLSGVILSGAHLSGTNLEGAYMHDEDGEKITLVGRRPIFQIGPIGSGSRYLIAFLTDQGLRLRTGCFFGTRELFEKKLADTHGDNVHAEEYRAALALIDAHERLWMPTDRG